MQFDIFGEKVSGFNIHGKQEVATRLGTLMTFITGVIVMTYSIAKFADLHTVNGSTFTQYKEQSAFTQWNSFNLQDRNFRVAFAFEGSSDKRLKNDPRYVRNIVRIHGQKNNEMFERIIPHHICSDADYA